MVNLSLLRGYLKGRMSNKVLLSVERPRVVLEEGWCRVRLCGARMTRDFLVSFDSEEEALIAEQQLSKVLVDGSVPLFGEIDNRGSDIFVALTYPSEITDGTVIIQELKLGDLVAFVAIKNGEHQSRGLPISPMV